jgi:pimeloyl-ACP methyl ester carboxylesterase
MVDIDRYRAAERRLFAAAGIEPKEHHLDLRRVGVNARLLETGDGEPTLFLTGGRVGTDDPVGGEDVARDLARPLPRADVEVLNDAGHLPRLDDPERAAKLMSSFPISANN